MSEDRPPTPTARLHEVTMAALNRRPAEPVSDVSISRNAKGDYQFEATVRGTDANVCLLVATSIIDRLRDAYPHSSELEAAAPAPEEAKPS